MQNNFDLSHVTRQIQKDTVEIKALRRQAQHQRDIASQKYQEENAHSGDHYEREADHLEQKADELESKIDELEIEKVRIEERIAELEAERARTDNSHPEHIASIDKQLAQLRGSGMML